MIQARQLPRLLGLGGAICAFLAPGIAHGQALVVSPTVSPFNGVFYHYSYSVTNDTTQGYDYPVITLGVPSQSSAIQNLFAPSGFNAYFDSVQGTLDFAEGAQAFAPGATVSGFQFDSPFAPAAASWTALAVDAAGLVVTDPNGNPVQFQGPTLAPSAPVPEASTAIPFILAIVPGLIFFGLRRRRSAAASAGAE